MRHAERQRAYDGVIVFGGVDWWYHNRGHFDVRMARELSKRLPVVYVNSIGMRRPSPSEGRVFGRRIARKLKSLCRGTVRIDGRFAVTSPVAPPALSSDGFAARSLARQVRRAAQRMGIERPLVWIACPPAVHTIGALEPAGVVFQRTDRFEAFHDIDVDSVSAQVEACFERADLTLHCSHALQADDARFGVESIFVDHGIDAGRFERAGRSLGPGPRPLQGVPTRRVGFVGGVDEHTFAPGLFRSVTRALPDAQFVVVGGRTLPDEAIAGPNVHLFPRVHADEVQDWMAACDVLVMPWNDSAWIRDCNPVKLKEYLAVGRPVVSTWFEELRHYDGLVRVARDARAFAREVALALGEHHDPEPGRARARGQGWDRRASEVVARLRELGLTIADGSLSILEWRLAS